MDPLVWTTIAEFWWIGPAVIGTGTAGWLGWLGLRHQRAERARRLAHEAAKHELRAARQRSGTARAAARVARAELTRAQAERTASHATSADVARARQELQAAQREARAAVAAVRAARARVTAARIALPRSSAAVEELPLSRLTAAHDAVTARWMEYETDAARLLAFPAMSDGRQPLTAAYLTVRAEATRLRPTTVQVSRSQVTAAQFAAYRDAVQRLERAFDAAEKEAWRQARAAGTAAAGEPSGTRMPSGSEAAGGAMWATIAQTAVARSAEALHRAADAAAAAIDDRLSGTAASETNGRPKPSPSPQQAPQPGSRPQAPQQRADAAASERDPVWPVPSRTSARPPSPER